MPQYKLTYFDCTGLGEAIRFLFAYGSIEYEDIRVPFDDFYKTVKKELPFGRAPILEIDGKVVAQSIAIARYLAIPLGLYGNDAWEGLLIDEAVGHIDDFRVKISTSYWEPDPLIKTKKMNDLKSDHIPYYLTKFERIVSENGGYFTLGRITLADIYFTSFLNYFNSLTEMNILQDRPNLAKLATMVENLPGIKEWMTNRPIGLF